MLRHIALFTFKPDADPAAIERYVAQARRLPDLIGGVRNYQAQPDVGAFRSGQPGNADFAVVADFADYDSFRAYTSHDAHKRLATEFLAPILASRSALQIDVAE